MSADTLISRAAHGELPEWAAVGPSRREHCRRVAELLEQWAGMLELTPDDRVRWSATGWLHDCVKKASADQQRAWADEPFRDLPDSMLHGPAAAAQLRREGVSDQAMLHAITWHTIGHPGFDTLGRALYVADFIEPGRSYMPDQLAAMRARMPAAVDTIVRDVVGFRLRSMLDERRPIRAGTLEFWNALCSDEEQ